MARVGFDTSPLVPRFGFPGWKLPDSLCQHSQHVDVRTTDVYKFTPAFVKNQLRSACRRIDQFFDRRLFTILSLVLDNIFHSPKLFLDLFTPHII